MSDNRRKSMNTSLKDADIFSDDPWESESVYDKLKEQTEPVDCISDNAQFVNITAKHTNLNVKYDKKVLLDVSDGEIIDFNFAQDELDINVSIKHEFEETTNDSTDSTSNQSRKSLRRTVFKRDTPYTKPEGNSMQHTSTSKSKMPSSTKHSDSRPAKKTIIEYEYDPAVLARRQKQIDFGKNTLGYDNYIRRVPRNERTTEDPLTPNKNYKYSRRAWDGLIKQWRLRLHKYDDP